MGETQFMGESRNQSVQLKYERVTLGWNNRKGPETGGHPTRKKENGCLEES